MSQSLTYLCIMAATHGLYAESFLREVKRQGHRLIVVTEARALKEYAWPREAIDGLYAVRNIFDLTELTNAVSYLAREEQIDRLVGLGEYDIELASHLREHLRIPGMGETTARYFRDKLAMRDQAYRRGVRVPAFVPAIHRPAIARFTEEVPAPWLIKPRTQASSKGIQVFHHAEQLWRALDALGDRASHHLIERFVPGDVFHVDAVVYDREVRFAAVHQYGRPILDLHTHGGVYTTRRVRIGSPEEKELLAFNREVIKALGMVDGVTHIEYIRNRESGAFYFLEAGARVGSGLIEEMVEAHSGVNLWAEWARLEAAELLPPYKLPAVREGHYAGVLATMAGVERPDARPFLEPGVHAAPTKPYHLGLIIESADPDWVEAKLAELADRVGRAAFAGH